MNLFQKSLSKKVNLEIKKELKYFVPWLPGTPLELGDVGEMNEGVFERKTNLKNLDIKFKIIKDKTKNDIKYQSEDTVEEYLDGKIEMSSNPIVKSKAKLRFEFNREGGIIFNAIGVKNDKIDDIYKLQQDVLKLKQWNKKWVIITEVVKAESAVVLISNSSISESSLGFGVETDILKNLNIANPELELYSISSKNMAVNLIAKEPLTILYKASKLKKTIFSSNLELQNVSKVRSVSMKEDLQKDTTKNKSDFQLKEIDIEDLN